MVKLAVIGGGPGGYVAAIRAAQLGADVTLIEKSNMGGTCLNMGCIPTKALLHSAELLEEAKNAGNYGIQLDVKGVDWNVVSAKKAETVNKLVSGVKGLMRANKIKVISAAAGFQTEKKLLLKSDEGTTEMEFDKIIIATGSVPAIPRISGIAGNPACVDSTAALSLEKIPQKMLVVGGGVIGVELARVYKTFGTEVTIVEAMPNILPFMDGELALNLKKILEKQGIKILVNAKVNSINKNSVDVSVGENSEKYDADVILLAVGRKANTAELGLEKIKLSHEDGRITVNKHMQTNLPNVYAIGDCLGEVMLAHVASAQGEIAAEHAMGRDAHYNGKVVPSCVYTNPEFAGVGVTEEMANELKLDYLVGRFPMMANGKGLIENGGVGMVKVIAGKEYNEILGVHILGPRATDLIAQSALAIGMEATTEDIIASIHAHPTVSEAVREGVLAVHNSAIHIPN